MVTAPEPRPDAFLLAGSFLVVCRSRGYLDELTRRGLRVLLITTSGSRPEAQAAASDPAHPAAMIDDIAFVDGDVSQDNSYLGGAVAAALGWRSRYRIVGAYAVGETQVEPTSLLADALGLRSPGLRAARVSRSKLLQRWYLPELSPAWAVVPPPERAIRDAATVAFPAVVKPVSRHSSSGVRAVRDPAELLAQLTTYPEHETVLVEERVVGQEFSVESLIQDGQIVFASVTRKETTDTGGATFVELAHTIPSDRPASEQTLLGANRRLLAALAFEDGIAHAEWRIDAAGRPILMEVAARPPGDGICELYHLACGRALEPEVIRIALGEPASFPPPTRPTRQIYLEHEPGVLRDVTVEWNGMTPQWVGPSGLWPRIGPAAPDDPPTLRAVLVHQHRGTLLGPLESSEDRAASVFIDAPSIAELDELESRVRDAVSVHTDPIAEEPAPEVLANVTHVLIGYSPIMIGKLDSSLPEGSVLVLEEPEVIRAQRVREKISQHRCVAALVPAPTQDEQSLPPVLGAVPRPPGVQVVVPVVEYGVVAAAALAEAWGLAGAGTKAARILRDKALLREAVAATDLVQPDWALAAGPDDVARFRSRYGGECVLKPANRQASVGVQLLGPDDDVTAAWRHTVGADEPTRRARHARARERFLVEQRLRGTELSVEALVHEGAVMFANVTAKQVLDSRYPVETGHSLPAALPAAATVSLREAMATLVAATGFRSGVLHAEWFLDGERPQLVECAGRLPGDGITVLVDLAYDTDILRELLAVLAGRPPAVRAEPVQGAAVRFLVAPPGVVQEVRGTAAASASAGVHTLHLERAPGDPVGSVTCSWERAGFVIAVGPDAEAAARNADQAAAQITIQVAGGGADDRADPAGHAR